MSCTEIYVLKKNNDLECFRTNNAWRSAMYIWNDIAERYLGWERFPLYGEKQMEVWNFHKRHPGVMKDYEIIVLLSTMDGAILEPTRIEEAMEAFYLYAKDHPDSSLKEQGDVLKKVLGYSMNDIENVIGIGWNQTSIGDTRWYSYDHDDVDNDTIMVYDFENRKDHFWVMEEFDLDKKLLENNDE